MAASNTYHFYIKYTGMNDSFLTLIATLKDLRESQSPHLPAQCVQPYHCPIVRTERPNRVCQDLLQGEQNLLIEATDKVSMSPVGARAGKE